jgi:hypothetical protein
MPFDPRLIHPDDAPLRADGELDLPADLAALANQLADDAVRLSARYPANREPQVALAAQLVESAERIKATADRRRARKWLTFISGAGVASVVAVVLSLSGWRPPADEQPVPPATFSPVLAGENGTPSSTKIGSLVAPPGTALSVGDLTAPEMEALFDLLQRDSNSTSSVSF